MFKHILLIILFLCAACASQPVHRETSIPLTTVSYVDLERYEGRWYEIARLPNRFEENCEGVTADYMRREDGLITVVNSCRVGDVDGRERQAKGRARIIDEETNAKLEVSFFGPFWGDYWIIDLAPDYSLAMVGEPAGKYLWILSRTPTISVEERDTALEKLVRFGYNIDALYFTKQPPAE